jgi:WD40 repeat protein
LQNRLERIALFDLQNRELFQETFPPVDGIELSSDGRWLVGGLRENNGTNVLLLDLNDPQKSFTLRGHTDQISQKYFTPDEQSLLTYGFDGTIRIWNLENPAGDPVVLNHDSRVSDVSFSGNGKWLISNTPQGIYIWQWSIEDVRNLACRLAGRNLTEDEWAKYMGAAPYEETCEQWPP